MAAEVTLYHAQGCTLCEDARTRLDELGVSYRAVDVGGDPELEARYRAWLPVVEIDGDRVSVHHLDEDAVLRRL